MNEDVIFTDQDRYSSTWMKVEEHLRARLEAARTRLERATTEAETLKVRGQIVEIRSLMSLVDEPMPVIL